MVVTIEMAVVRVCCGAPDSPALWELDKLERFVLRPVELDNDGQLSKLREIWAELSPLREWSEWAQWSDWSTGGVGGVFSRKRSRPLAPLAEANNEVQYRRPSTSSQSSFFSGLSPSALFAKIRENL
ncbi:hypothetical protein AAG570_003671 [Ranatra chinensis]|uniref:Uncharacterized protein n=1 Tax=Ranatra chinensis TaxID=642074 RepID=A0ABD0Y4B4_9HEMI